jgi:hypothetical protein
VERLRGEGATGYVLLNACDPASPYGGDLAPAPGWRIRRRGANEVLLENGACVLYAEGHGARWCVRHGDVAAVNAYLERRSGDPLSVEQINAGPASESEFASYLAAKGFTRQGGGALRQGFAHSERV